jgi:hypothetical protein
MILPAYRIAASTVPGAGKGLFVEQSVAAGRVLVAPDAIPRVHSLAEVESHPAGAQAAAASVRWFEDRYTISLDWPDECYINHSFEPNGLWHLGFIFAAHDIAAGEELTIDYRHLLPPGEREPFLDAATGQPIVGFAWEEGLRRSTLALAALVAE